jgi:hypothetical protein
MSQSGPENPPRANVFSVFLTNISGLPAEQHANTRPDILTETQKIFVRFDVVKKLTAPIKVIGAVGFTKESRLPKQEWTPQSIKSS